MAGVETYGAANIGSSCTGLAAAGQPDGSVRVGFADREPVGTGGTSACVLVVRERVDAGAVLEPMHAELVINVARDVRPPSPAGQWVTRPAGDSGDAIDSDKETVTSV